MDDKLFGKSTDELLGRHKAIHSDFHAANAFCGNAGPHELKHLQNLINVLTDDELAKLVSKVGIKIGGPSMNVDRETLENVIDEADREQFYEAYRHIIENRG